MKVNILDGVSSKLPPAQSPNIKEKQVFALGKYKKFNILIAQAHESDRKRQLNVSNVQAQRPKVNGVTHNVQHNKLSKNSSESILINSKNSKNKRLPITPRKQVLNHQDNQNTKKQYESSGKNKLKQIIGKLRLIIKDFQSIISNLQNQINQNVKMVIKHAQIQIHKFLKQQLQMSQKLKNLNENFSSLNNSYETPSKMQAFIKCSSKIILDELPETTKLRNSYMHSAQNNRQQSSINRSYVENGSQGAKKSSNFSHMITLKEKIRKQAIAPVHRNMKLKLQQIPIMIVDEQSPNGKKQYEQQLVRSSHRKNLDRDASKSVQKLQKHLHSLKNMLDQ